jgi:hypothetical protein
VAGIGVGSDSLELELGLESELELGEVKAEAGGGVVVGGVIEVDVGASDEIWDVVEDWELVEVDII